MSSDETVSDVEFSKAVNIGFNYKSQGNDEWSYHSLTEHASGIQTVQTSVLSPRHLHYWVRIPLLSSLVPQPTCCLTIVWHLGSILTINRQRVPHLKLTLTWILYFHIFIGPESDHWLCLSVTHSLTDSLTDSLPFSKLFDVSLACEDGNSKLVEVAFLDWNQIV